jgi:hypothetical protein
MTFRNFRNENKYRKTAHLILLGTFMSKEELVNAAKAAQLASTTERTITDWVEKGWLKVAQALAVRPIGRPGRLFRKSEVLKVAKERGRV